MCIKIENSQKYCLILIWLLLTFSYTEFIIYYIFTMKNILIAFSMFMIFMPGVFAYTPSEDLQEKIDIVSMNIQETIDEYGEIYRSSFINTLEEYKVRYAWDERVLYILDYLLNAIKITSSERPNILLIIADDMWLDATPGYNEWSTKPNMPHLESMMDAGLTYENLWSAPTCTPTRSTIITGKYGYHTNMLAVDDYLSTDETSIQSYLDTMTNNAYDHAVVGKWHIGNDADHPSEMWVGYYAGMLSWGVKDYSEWRLTENGSTARSSEYITTKITDLAIDWVEDKQDPWFLWVAYTAPHSPFHLPPSDLHTQDHLSGTQDDIEDKPEDYYMAMLESLDTEMWRLLDGIPEEELAQTVIIFIGDNGTPGQVAQYPYDRHSAKGSLYQWGINVPMVVSGYGVERNGERETTLINTTDIYATIADIANTGTTSIHNSMSFVDSLSSEDFSQRQYVYGEVADKRISWYTIRDQRYKLIVFDNGDEEMYDLSIDPYENSDLIALGLTSEQVSAKEILEEYVLDAQKK